MRAPSILIACEVVASELQSRIGEDLPVRKLDPSLHVYPDRLRTTIQEAIDEEENNYETLILGYGLCSRAVEGLKSKKSRLVFPLVDDCIGLFLGSKTAHKAHMKSAPGTFFLSKGWMDVGSTPFTEYEYMLGRFGEKAANRLMKAILKNYTRLTYIGMEGAANAQSYQDYARSKAKEHGLEYEEVFGSTALFDELIQGGGSSHIRIVPPGETIRYEMYMGDDN
ncbi:DUF1638 domain-containing protein [Desulfatibacillum aliphaticivorans]|uniref:DUF1638 domain-containing protein n=1 Tax=Desulfatibacillum aliphaticivorans TaxID=218208 RepID=UPI0004172085|nr:DUF1638 domain-containing protein [Desulfatibacillum aliphaticivorans]